jgi:hypothetical protein
MSNLLIMPSFCTLCKCIEHVSATTIYSVPERRQTRMLTSELGNSFVYNHKMSVALEWVKLLLRIREVLGSDVHQDTSYKKHFRCFPQSPRQIYAIIPRVKQQPFLPHPFQFKILLSFDAFKCVLILSFHLCPRSSKRSLSFRPSYQTSTWFFFSPPPPMPSTTTIIRIDTSAFPCQDLNEVGRSGIPLKRASVRMNVEVMKYVEMWNEINKRRKQRWVQDLRCAKRFPISFHCTSCNSIWFKRSTIYLY